MKMEILRLKIECEKLKTDKIALLDQFKKSSNENVVVLLQKVENLEMANRNLQVEIEQQVINKFIVNNDVRSKFYAGIDSYDKLEAGEREITATLPMIFREHFQRCVSIIVLRFLFNDQPSLENALQLFRRTNTTTQSNI